MQAGRCGGPVVRRRRPSGSISGEDSSRVRSDFTHTCVCIANEFNIDPATVQVRTTLVRIERPPTKRHIDTPRKLQRPSKSHFSFHFFGPAAVPGYYYYKCITHADVRPPMIDNSGAARINGIDRRGSPERSIRSVYAI